MAGIGLLGAPAPAYAAGVNATATPSITITETADGQPPFDAVAGPGNDTGANNGVVRTNQLITYSVAMSINDKNSSQQTTFQDATATFAPLPLGFVWNSIPVDCAGPNTKLTGDGVTTPSVLVCDFGAKTTGTTWTFAPAIRTLRTAVPGTTVAPTAILSATGMLQTAMGTAPGAAVSVSAAPKAGVTKFNMGGGTADVVNGQPATRFYWPLGIHIDDGSDIIDGNSFSFTDDLSSLPAGATFQGCFGGLLQYGPATFAFGSPLRGVPNNGGATWTCTMDPNNSKLVHITVTGVNTNPDPSACPVLSSNGTPLPPGMCYISTQGISVSIPNSSLNGSTGVSGTNWASQLSAKDLAGNPNYGGNPDPGTGLDNNQVASNSFLVGRQHGWTSILRGPATSAPGFSLGKSDSRFWGMPVGSNWNTGDGYATQASTYMGTVQLGLGGIKDMPAGFIMCQTIDNVHDTVSTTSQLPNFASMTGYSSVTAAGMWTIQYGTGGNGGVNPGDGTGWASFAAQQQGSCNTSDSPAWYSSVSQVPGGAGAVTKVRYVLNQTLTIAAQVAAINAGQAYIAGNVGLIVRPTTPNGTVIPNYGWATGDPDAVTATNPSGTVVSTYNYADASGGTFGDRVTITGVRVLVGKSSDRQQYLAGQTTTFTLSPSSSALQASPAPQALNTVLTDTLPKGLSHVGGTAVGSTNFSASCGTVSCAPASVTVNADGTTTLVWNLGTTTAGTALPKISYKALISATTPVGTNYTNTVVISADNDSSPAQYRTATATININGGASFAVDKSTPQPLTEPGTQKTFNITFRNLSSVTYPGTDFIDWLPFNGDQRTPPSSIQGTSTLAGPAVDVAGAQAVTFKYTSFPTAQLNMATDTDPATANTAIVWCDSTQFGTAGCPANYAAATGIRISGGQIAAQQSDTVTYSLNVAGDVKGNIFSNQTTGEVSGIGLPISSNTATVRTVLGSIAGTVWDDTATIDGLHATTGEAGLAGTTVQLLNTAGAVIGSAVTDSAGHYVFGNLVHGDYKIHVIPPAGYYTTLPLQGSDPAVNSKIAYGTNSTATITLAVGQNDSIEHAGLFKAAPSITLEKRLNGSHVPDPAKPLLVATGSTMDVTFKVTNTGNTALDPVKVTDDTVKAITCPATTLAVGASMDCTATIPAPASPGGTHTNHAQTTGSPRGLDGTPLVDANGNKAADVTATDEAHAVTPDPRISVVKTINNDDASHAAPGALVPNNAPMPITFTVKNEGNVPLTSVTVADDVVPASGIACPQTTLPVGESITCTATFPAPAPQVQHTDTATVKGTPPVLADGTVLPDVTATAKAFAYTAAHPAITVVKTINGSNDSHQSPGVGVVAGTTLQIIFEVRNSGDVRLEPVTVTDSVATAPILCQATGLDPGETTTCTTTTGPASGADHKDTATAKGTAATPDGDALVDLGTGDPVGDVTATADAFAHALTPGIGLVKKINGIIAADTDHAVLVPAGSAMAVTFEITNTGETTLNAITLTDDVIPAADITCPATTLKTGATMTCTATATAPTSGDFHHNTGTVTGQPLGPDGDAQGGTITTTAEAFAHTPAPNVTITKKINGDDSNSAATAVHVPAKELMTVTFEVKNTGDVTLDPVTITDDVVPAKAISCPATVLAPGASLTCTATYPAPAPGALHTNHATVTATPPAYWDGTTEPDVTATDEANAYTDGHPAIALIKTINGEDANTGPGVLVKPGSAMNVAFTATNTGDVPLDTITITDEPAAEITCPKAATLNPGKTLTCTTTITAPAAGGTHTDTGTVTARPLDPAGNPLTDPTTGVTAGTVTASDPANAHAGNPSITLAKEVCQTPTNSDGSDCVGWLPETRFQAGNTGQWRLTITNTGDTPLTGITLTDSVEPTCQTPQDTTLDPGKSVTVLCTTTNITAEELINTATATGTPTYPQDVTGKPVTSDPATAKITTYKPDTPEAHLAYTGTIIEKLTPWAAGILSLGLLLLLATRRRKDTVAATQETINE